MSKIGAYSKRRKRYKANLDARDEDGYTCASVYEDRDGQDEDFNLVSSQLRPKRRTPGVAGGMHSPALDIDIPIEVWESSTPGHYHLYFPTLEVPWRRYRQLLVMMANCGIISHAYCRYSIDRGETLLRPPHLRKSGETVTPRRLLGRNVTVAAVGSEEPF
jgi:hypothetical protein